MLKLEDIPKESSNKAVDVLGNFYFFTGKTIESIMGPKRIKRAVTLLSQIKVPKEVQNSKYGMYLNIPYIIKNYNAGFIRPVSELPRLSKDQYRRGSGFYFGGICYPKTIGRTQAEIASTIVHELTHRRTDKKYSKAEKGIARLSSPPISHRDNAVREYYAYLSEVLFLIALKNNGDIERFSEEDLTIRDCSFWQGLALQDPKKFIDLYIDSLEGRLESVEKEFRAYLQAGYW